MQGTACANCAKKKCPFQMESWWRGPDGESKLITDCAPKRTMLLQQELANGQIRQQAAIEQLRDEMQALTGVLGKLITQIESHCTTSGDNHRELAHVLYTLSDSGFQDGT